jgi:hypothetical protein
MAWLKTAVSFQPPAFSPAGPGDPDVAPVLAFFSSGRWSHMQLQSKGHKFSGHSERSAAQ